MQRHAEHERERQCPRTEPAHGMERFRRDRKERHGMIRNMRKEKLAVGPHKVGNDPQRLHDVVHVVDQAALKAEYEGETGSQRRERQTLTCAVCQAKSSAMRTVGMENTIHVTCQF